jgi:hypothetical protein
MRGGDTHNWIVDQLARAAEQGGAATRREYPIRPGRHPKFVDLWAKWERWTIAFEVEMNPRRGVPDVEKVNHLDVDILAIVTPTRHVARAIRKALHRRGYTGDRGEARRPRVYVFPLYAVLQQIANRGLLMSVSIVTQTSIPDTDGHDTPGPEWLGREADTAVKSERRTRT